MARRAAAALGWPVGMAVALAVVTAGFAGQRRALCRPGLRPGVSAAVVYEVADEGDAGVDGALAGVAEAEHRLRGPGAWSARQMFIPQSRTDRDRAAWITSCSAAAAGRCATAWKPAARPVNRTPGACSASAWTSTWRRAAYSVRFGPDCRSAGAWRRFAVPGGIIRTLRFEPNDLQAPLLGSSDGTNIGDQTA